LLLLTFPFALYYPSTDLIGLLFLTDSTEYAIAYRINISQYARIATNLCS